MTIKPVKVLGTFALALITVAAIVSLRNLLVSAELGFSSIFFLTVAVIIFFIPTAMMTAELAATWPKAGCSYAWVSEAFGKPWGLLALWVAWMESIAWFPAILAFTAAMLAHLLAPIFPDLETSKLFLFTVMLVIFWGATFINFFGIQISGWVSSLGVLTGTIIPGGLIIALGCWWVYSGQHLQIDITWKALIPEFELDNVVIFAGILLSLAGVELAAFHITEAKHPQKDYPKALGIASLIIVVVYILGTLAIAVVVPQQDISLASGIIQAFKVFFAALNMQWMVPFLALLLFVGALAGINTWIVGPAKGLLVAAEDGFLPSMLKRINTKNVPTSLLVLQALIGSVLSLVFLYMDDSSASIWILIALSAQFAVVQYIMMFCAILRLRFSQPNTERPYKVKWLWLVAMIGISSCLFGFFIVYVPPAQLNVGDRFIYQLILMISFVILILPPLLMAKLRTR